MARLERPFLGAFALRFPCEHRGLTLPDGQSVSEGALLFDLGHWTQQQAGGVDLVHQDRGRSAAVARENQEEAESRSC